MAHRREFQLVARVLSDPRLELQDAQRSALTNLFATEFAKVNRLFRRDLFFADCGALDFESLAAQENDVIDAIRERLDRSAPASEVAQGDDPSRPTRTELIGASDASRAQALDEFRDVLGDRRVDQLAELMQPLSTWLEDQPDAWVRARRLQLGPPGQDLHRGDARRALLLDRQRTRLEERISRTREQGKQLEARADAIWEAKLQARILRPPRVKDQVEGLDAMAQVEFQEADKAAMQLDHVEQRRHELRQQGRDLDSLIAHHGTELILSAAYADTYERRRDKYIAQGIDAALDKPSKDIVGPRPHKSSPHYAEWAAITRTVESARLATEFDRRNSDMHHAAGPELSEDLSHRIDHLRAERGIEPLAHEHQPQPAMQPNGREPF